MKKKHASTSNTNTNSSNINTSSTHSVEMNDMFNEFDKMDIVETNDVQTNPILTGGYETSDVNMSSVQTPTVHAPTIHAPTISTTPLTIPDTHVHSSLQPIVSKINSLNDVSDERNVIKIPTSVAEFF